MPAIERDEFQTAMMRAHERIDAIGQSVTRQEAIVERIEAFGDKIHTAIFGNGKPGVLTRLANLEVGQKIYIVIYGSLAFLQISTTIGIAVAVIKTGVIK